VLERAVLAGVRGVVAVGENLTDARRNLELAASFPGLVYPAAGLFPTILDPVQAAAIADLLRGEPAGWVAIGEVGLDYWKVQDEEEREVQRSIFTDFVRLARELDLPLNVHSRSAGRATIELLLELGAERVQMHAFDGRAANALPGVEAGFFFSVPPSIVRSPQKRKLIGRLPLTALLLESDAPVLGPVPSERNEPANVTVALDAIAEIHGIARQAVVEVVAENALRLYGLGE
jgi:TatD DNase family protein